MAIGWWRPAEQTARLWVRPSWEGDGGVRQLLAVSIPLMLSALSGVVNLFFDRYFLAKYDLQYHMAATHGAGATWWAVQHFMLATVFYVSTFVAQYHGAGRDDRIGASIWQGLYMSLAGGLLNMALWPLWGPLYRAVHGEGLLSQLEAEYCQALGFGTFFLLANAAFGAFYAGRGRTVFVMITSFLIAILNILLNRWLIFSPPDWLPFVEPGIVGAAWGTNISLAAGSLVYMAAVFRPVHEREYKLLSSWRLNPALFRRILRFGAPQGFQHFVEISAFAFFFLMVGRVSQQALVASNIAITVNMIVFMAMVGVAQGLGMLVGRFVARSEPDLAEKATTSAVALNTIMTLPGIVLYLAFPGLLVGIFVGSEVKPEFAAQVHELARAMLIVVAVYSLGDVIGVTYSSAIKGAGDTRFVFECAALSAVFVLIIPCALIAWTGGSALRMWVMALGYIMVIGAAFVARYWAGRWRTMSVIEPDLCASDSRVMAPPPEPV